MSYQSSSEQNPYMDMKNILTLLDGDSFIYRIVTLHEDELDWGIVKYELDRYFIKILNDTNAAFYLGFIEGRNRGNFRKELTRNHPLVPEYKAGRPPKPAWFWKAAEYLISRWHFVLVDEIESDDAICICNKRFKKPTVVGHKEILLHPVMSTHDKDYMQVVGTHFDFVTHVWREVDPIGKVWVDDKGKIRGYGVRFFWSQMITGDSTDNVIGIRNARKKLVVETLMSTDSFDELEALVQQWYIDKYDFNADEIYHTNMALLRLLRDPERGFKIPEPVPYGNIVLTEVEAKPRNYYFE